MGATDRCSTTSVDMMNNFLHTPLSSDTALVKVDTEVHLEVALENKACMGSHIKDMACPLRHLTTIIPLRQPILVGLVNSSNNTRLQGGTVLQAQACRVITVLDQPSLQSTSNSIQEVVLAAMVVCRIHLAVLGVASKDKTMDLGSNNPAHMEVMMILSAGSVTRRNYQVGPVRLRVPVPDRQSTICKGRQVYRRGRIKISKRTPVTQET